MKVFKHANFDGESRSMIDNLLSIWRTLCLCAFVDVNFASTDRISGLLVQYFVRHITLQHR